MRAWTEIRTELKGTSGGDLGSLAARRQHMQLYSLHHGRKMRIPPPYAFQLANGDEGVNRSELVSILLKRFSKDKCRMGNPRVSCYILISDTRLMQMLL